MWSFTQKLIRMLHFRKAEISDLNLYYHWAMDETVRNQSFNSATISLENHSNWFLNRLKNLNSLLLIFFNEQKQDVGQVRIEKQIDNQAVIGISVDKNFRGLAYSSDMLQQATTFFFEHNHNFAINAYIKVENIGSQKAFEKANFLLKEIIIYENHKSFHYIKKGL